MGTSRATSRRNSSAITQKEVVAAEKAHSLNFCHCQNLTVPWRARLKLVHPSGPIQLTSLVSWWKESEAVHAISHARNDADNRLPLRTLDSTRCRQSFTCRKNTKNSDSIPTVINQYLNSMQNSNPKNTKFTGSNKTVFSKFSNSNKTVFETVMQSVFEKNHFHQQ